LTEDSGIGSRKHPQKEQQQKVQKQQQQQRRAEVSGNRLFPKTISSRRLRQLGALILQGTFGWTTILAQTILSIANLCQSKLSFLHLINTLSSRILINALSNRILINTPSNRILINTPSNRFSANTAVNRIIVDITSLSSN